MKRFPVIICIFSFMCLLPCAFASNLTTETINTDGIESIIEPFEKVIEQTMKANGIPGLAIAIVSKDKVYYLKGFGVRKIGKPEKITPTTLFQIASLSKPVNATVIGMLQERGKLSVDDSLDRYIPHFKLRNKTTPVKISHLLSHSSGLPNHFNGMIDIFTPREDVIARIQRTYAVADPGKNYDYNNAVYSMVEDVMHKVSGKPLDQLLHQELFQPLGMKNASVGLSGLLTSPNKAHPHVPNKKGRYVPAGEYSKAYYGFSSAGGVNASVRDLIPFMQMYLGKPSPVISKQGLYPLTTPFVKNNKAVIKHEARNGLVKDTYYCLGWQSMQYAERPVIYHTGHLKGFRNFMGYIDDDVGIIILTNAHRRHASKLALKFFDLYLKSQGIDVADKVEPTEAPKKGQKQKSKSAAKNKAAKQKVTQS